MKRRFNGEGNIRKRSEHSWEASVAIEGGERIYLYGASQKEVKDKLQKIQSEIANGTYIADNDMTVGEWMDEWYECFTSGVKASSRARYEQDIRIHIKPGIGHINLQDLKLLHVQRFLNQCKDKKNLAQKTVKNIYLVLNKALKKAQSQGLIRQNPCGEAEIPSYDTPQKEMRPLKDAEVARFLKQISGHPDEFFLYMALFTGMRESELIGLTWDCVDFDRCTLYINKQLQKTKKVGGEYALVPTKNSRGRIVMVAGSVIELLKEASAKLDQ